MLSCFATLYHAVGYKHAKRTLQLHESLSVISHSAIYSGLPKWNERCIYIYIYIYVPTLLPIRFVV